MEELLRNDNSEHVGILIHSALVEVPVGFDLSNRWVHRDVKVSYCLIRGRLKSIFPAVARLYVELDITSVREEPYI